MWLLVVELVLHAAYMAARSLCARARVCVCVYVLVHLQRNMCVKGVGETPQWFDIYSPV